MANTNKIIQPYSNVPYIPLNEVSGTERKGAQFLSNVKQLSVGFGSRVFRVDRDGMWAGAETFAAAPWSVDWDGNMVATSLDLSGYLEIGEALTDIGSGNITSVYIANGAITASKISVSSLSAISADIGSVTSGTITGTLIRTSSSGARIELDDTNDRIRIYDSSNVERMRLNQETLGFYDGSGNLTGTIGALFSNILAVNIPSGELGFIVYYNSTAKLAVSNNGTVVYDDIEAGGASINIGSAAQPFEDFFIDDIRLTAQTSNPSSDGMMRYYDSGGSEGLRMQFGGADFQFDASGV